MCYIKGEFEPAPRSNAVKLFELLATTATRVPSKSKRSVVIRIITSLLSAVPANAIYSRWDEAEEEAFLAPLRGILFVFFNFIQYFF